MEVEDVESKLSAKILKFLALKPRSEYETRQRLARYLFKFDFTQSEKDLLISRIIEQLKTEHFLDDSRYVEDFKNSLEQSSKPRGVGYFRKFLAKKGIKSDLIEKTTLEVDPELEFEAAKKLAQKKLPTIKSKKRHDLKRKLWTFLMYRGYPPDVIGRAIDSVTSLD